MMLFWLIPSTGPFALGEVSATESRWIIVDPYALSPKESRRLLPRNMCNEGHIALQILRKTIIIDCSLRSQMHSELVIHKQGKLFIFPLPSGISGDYVVACS